MPHFCAIMGASLHTGLGMSRDMWTFFADFFSQTAGNSESQLIENDFDFTRLERLSFPV
jgi:hypothetical protein